MWIRSGSCQQKNQKTDGPRRDGGGRGGMASRGRLPMMMGRRGGSGTARFEGRQSKPWIPASAGMTAGRVVPERPLRDFHASAGYEPGVDNHRGVVPTIRSTSSPTRNGAQECAPYNRIASPPPQGTHSCVPRRFPLMRRRRFPNRPYGDGRPWRVTGRRDNPPWLSFVKKQNPGFRPSPE